MANPHLPETLRRSVVKIFTVIKEPNYYQPWESGLAKDSGGSGCILPQNRILTNAHVVAHSVYIQVQKPDSPKKYTAKLLHVDHDSELALLAVDDLRFFEGTVPVRLGDSLPLQNTTVSVYGFALGGNDMCITTGVVSRIEVQNYTHSRRSLLALQTDAVINSGSSGGPVFMNDELVGVAFQSHSQEHLSNTGYAVPVPIINQFFEDLLDGKIGGIPDLGVTWQSIENESLREYLGLGEHGHGVLISGVVPGAAVDKIVRIGDVLIAVDSTPIASDGTVELSAHHRARFTHLVSRRQVGDSLKVEVIRDRQSLTLEVTLRQLVALVPPPAPDHTPRYFIFAGIVFVPLTFDYMSSWEWTKLDFRFKYYYYNQLPTPRRREVVLVSHVLAHDINIGYHQVRGAIVERINGMDIGEMNDISQALREPLGRFHVIEIDNHSIRAESHDYYPGCGSRIVIGAGAASLATGEIIAQYGIKNSSSPDVTP